MTYAQPQNLPLLLNVFRRGLSNGLVSAKEVVEWADNIILEQDQPDYFFIELSLASNTDKLLEVLGAAPIEGASTLSRVLFGLLYVKLANNIVDGRKAMSVLDEVYYMEALSRYETDSYYELDDEFDYKYGMKNFDEWETNALVFLSNYKDFTLNNVAEWPAINNLLEAHFETLEQASVRLHQKSNREDQQQAKKQNAATRIGFALLTLVALLVVAITYIRLQNQQPLTKFNKDLYSLCILIVSLFVCYQVMMVIYWVMRKMVKE
jgi:hypothetical protein